MMYDQSPDHKYMPTSNGKSIPVAPPDPPPSARELVSKIGYEAYEVNYMLGEILKFISSDSANIPKDRASTENLLAALMESAGQVHDAHSKVVAIQRYLGINELTNNSSGR